MTYDSTPAPLTLRVGAELVSGPTARKRWVFVRRRRASPSIRLADTQSKAKDADTNFTNSHHLTPRVPSRRLKAIKFVQFVSRSILFRTSDATFQESPELSVPLPLEVCMKTYYWLNRNRIRSHLRTSFCALAIVGALLTLSSAQAGGPPLPASGEFFPCFNYAGPPRQVGENLIITFNISGWRTSTGTLIGYAEGTELDVVHRDGSITLHGTFLFTGSVGGRSGTMLFSYEGIGNAVTGHETLRFVGNQGTGDLAGTYANLTAEGDVVPPDPNSGCDLQGAGTYTGQVVFAR